MIPRTQRHLKLALLIFSAVACVWLAQFRIVHHTQQTTKTRNIEYQHKPPAKETQNKTSTANNHTKDKNLEISQSTTRSKESSTLIIDNVLLMGQFNYDDDDDEGIEFIVAWKKAWSRYFLEGNILVAGPFRNSTQQLLTKANISYLVGRNDKGFVSPYENLANAVQQQISDSNHNIQAVLYLHDDALLNVSNFIIRDTGDGTTTFPTRKFAGTFSWDFFYDVPRDEKSADQMQEQPGYRQEQSKLKKERYYQLQVTYGNNNNQNSTGSKGNGSPAATSIRYFDATGKEYSSRNDLLQHSPLKQWQGWESECMIPQEKILSRHFDYVQQYGKKVETNSWMVDFVGYGQSDILLVPMANYDEFVSLAKLFAKYDLFLECAIPNLVHHMIQRQQRDEQNTISKKKNDSALSSSLRLPTTLSLCTSWNYKKDRGKIGMIRNCWKSNAGSGGFHMAHPFKIKTRGIPAYNQWLDRIQRPLVG